MKDDMEVEVLKDTSDQDCHAKAMRRKKLMMASRKHADMMNFDPNGGECCKEGGMESEGVY